MLGVSVPVVASASGSTAGIRRPASPQLAPISGEREVRRTRSHPHGRRRASEARMPRLEPRGPTRGLLVPEGDGSSNSRGEVGAGSISSRRGRVEQNSREHDSMGSDGNEGIQTREYKTNRDPQTPCLVRVPTSTWAMRYRPSLAGQAGQSNPKSSSLPSGTRREPRAPSVCRLARLLHATSRRLSPYLGVSVQVRAPQSGSRKRRHFEYATYSRKVSSALKFERTFRCVVCERPESAPVVA